MTLPQMMQMLSVGSSAVDSVEVPNSTLESLQDLAPFVPEEKREEFEKIVTPAKAVEQKILTPENIKWLIGIILPIFLYFLPDKNAEEQVKLHKESNDIGREIVESLEPDSEEEMVEKFLKYLDDNGFVLVKKDEVAYERFEGTPNCVGVLEKDVNAVGDLIVSDKQDENADAQNENQGLQP